MAKIFTGGITLAKVNNGNPIFLTLNSNLPTSQVINVDSGAAEPDWSKSPFLVITPDLAVNDESGNFISRVENLVWSINGKTSAADLATFEATAQSTFPFQLTIKKNLVDIDNLYVKLKGDYIDPITNNPTPVTSEINYSRSKTAGLLMSSTMIYEYGADFTNTIDKLSIECELKRGETIATDPNEYSAVWYRKSGSSWVKIDSSDPFGTEGYTSSILTVPIKSCPTRLELKCEITDVKVGSSTNGQTIINEALLINKEDPIQLSVVDSKLELSNVPVDILFSTTSSTTSGYFDTGIKLSEISEYYIKYRIKTANADAGLYGVAGLERYIEGSIGKFKNGTEVITSPVVLNEWYSEALSNNEIFINGERIGTLNRISADTDTFKFNSVGSETSASGMEISNVSIVKTSGAIVNYVPIKSEETIGWMDTSTSSLVNKVGTGWPIAGNIIASGGGFLKIQLIQGGKVLSQFKMSKLSYSWKAVDEDGNVMTFLITPGTDTTMASLNRTSQLRPYVTINATYK